MRNKPRNPWLLIVGISGVSLIAWFVNTYPPDSIVRITIFFFLFFLVSLPISLFFLNNVRRAILLSLGLTVVFLLRILGLRETIYFLLLFISLFSIELMLQKRQSLRKDA